MRRARAFISYVHGPDPISCAATWQRDGFKRHHGNFPFLSSQDARQDALRDIDDIVIILISSSKREASEMEKILECHRRC